MSTERRKLYEWLEQPQDVSNAMLSKLSSSSSSSSNSTSSSSSSFSSSSSSSSHSTELARQRPELLEGQIDLSNLPQLAVKIRQQSTTFKLGVIYGLSGTGKSTLLNLLNPIVSSGSSSSRKDNNGDDDISGLNTQHLWRKDQAIISQLHPGSCFFYSFTLLLFLLYVLLTVVLGWPDLSPAEAEAVFGNVGLNSIPVWLKPYHVLSEGIVTPLIGLSGLFMSPSPCCSSRTACSPEPISIFIHKNV